MTALEKDNQLLCNGFMKWTTWADLIIRVDKCHTFGIKKTKTKSDQFQPFITIRNERIPPIENGKSFTYLGKDFNCSRNCDEIKTELQNEIVKHVDIIDKLPIKCLHQIEIIQRYVISKLKWRFSVFNLSETWISENLDSHINRYYRKWLNIPVSGNITYLTLFKSKLGLSIKTCQQIYVECKLGVRRALKTSLNEDIRNLYKLTSAKNVNSDSILEKINSTEKRTIKNRSCDLLSTQSKESTWNSFLNLKEQCGIISFLANLIPPSHLVQWQKMTSSLPNNIQNLARRYFIHSFLNAANLQRWKLKENSN